MLNHEKELSFVGCPVQLASTMPTLCWPLRVDGDDGGVLARSTDHGCACGQAPQRLVYSSLACRGESLLRAIAVTLVKSRLPVCVLCATHALPAREAMGFSGKLRWLNCRKSRLGRTIEATKVGGGNRAIHLTR